MLRRYYFFLFAISLISLAACATMGPRYSEMDIIQTRISEGEARLYFLRESRVLFSGRTAPIKIGGKDIGKLRNGGFFFVDLAPGTYRISTETWDAGRFSIQMEVEADKVYYIEAIPREKFLGVIAFAVGGLILENKGMFALVPINEENAAQKLPNLRYSK